MPYPLKFCVVRVKLILLMSFLMLTGTVAHAANCTLSSTGNLNFGSRTFNTPRDASAGKVLATKTITYTAACSQMSVGNIFAIKFRPNVANCPPGGNPNFLATSPISSIGVSFLNTAVPAGGTGSSGICTSSSTAPNGRFFDLVYSRITSTSQTFTFTVNADLVTLGGRVPTGTSSFNGTIAHMDWVILGVTPNMAFNSGSVSADISLSASATVVPRTCQVTTTNIVIPLTSTSGISTRTFTGVGSGSGWTSAIPIKLDCTDVTTDIYMTVTDATKSTNTSSILSLTSSSSATGVGIELSVFGIPKMSFGPDSSRARNTNQFWVTGTTGGVVQVNLSARYVQTASRVTAGTANGAATFTMSYQ